MKCRRCGVEITSFAITHDPIYCSDACENGERDGLSEFLNRLRLLRGLDSDDVPFVGNWHDFRDDPGEYLISCPDDVAKHIWTALRKREG